MFSEYSGGREPDEQPGEASRVELPDSTAFSDLSSLDATAKPANGTAPKLEPLAENHSVVDDDAQPPESRETVDDPNGVAGEILIVSRREQTRPPISVTEETVAANGLVTRVTEPLVTEVRDAEGPGEPPGPTPDDEPPAAGAERGAAPDDSAPGGEPLTEATDGEPPAPPQLPGPGELADREPSPLAVAIAGRWRDDITAVTRMLPFHARDELATLEAGSSPSIPLTRTYQQYVDWRLRDPDAEIEPAILADAVVSEYDIDTVAQELHASRTESGVVPPPLTEIEQALGAEGYRDLRDEAHSHVVGRLMTEIASWNRGPESPKDHWEFARVKAIAEERGLDPIEVFKESELYAQIFREAYPGGASDYVSNRMELSVSRGSDGAREFIHNEILFAMARAQHSPVEVTMLNPGRSQSLMAGDHIMRLATNGRYDKDLQVVLAQQQREAVLYTLAKVQAVWGETEVPTLPVRQQAWLAGDQLGTADMLPPADVNFRLFSNIAQGVISEAASHAQYPLNEEDIAALTEMAGTIMARATQLSPGELLHTALVLDVEARKLITEHLQNPEQLDADLTNLAQGEDGLGRLAVDTIEFGYLDQYLPLDVGRSFEQVMNMRDQWSNVLRQALALHQLRAMYRVLLRDRVEEGPAYYYASDHFRAVDEFMRRASILYFTNPTIARATEDTIVDSATLLRTQEEARRIQGTVGLVDPEDLLPYDREGLPAYTVRGHLARLAEDSFWILNYDNLDHLPAAEVTFTDDIYRHQDLRANPGGPIIRQGTLNVGDRAIPVIVRSYYETDALQEAGTDNTWSAAVEYAAAEMLDRIARTPEDLHPLDVLGFCRYFDRTTVVDPMSERIGVIVEPNESVVPYATRLFGADGNRQPTASEAFAVVTAMGESLAALHRNGYTLGGTPSTETLAEDDEGMRFCLSLQHADTITPLPSVSMPIYRQTDYTQDLLPAIMDIMRWGDRVTDTNAQALRREFFAAYKRTAQARGVTQSEPFWEVLEEALNV
jgi:hypothetical protein